MRELKLKILIVRLCQKIAIAKLNGLDSEAEKQDALKIVQNNATESLGVVSFACLDYILSRTEEEIIKGIIDNHPLAIKFDNLQIKELHNV